MRKLTARQQRFIELYPLLLNATEAARQAGYTGRDVVLRNTGSQLLTVPYVRDAIVAAKAAMTQHAVVTQEDIFQGLLGMARSSRHEPSRVRAYELAGKHLGMFVERTESRNVNVNVDAVRYKLAIGADEEPKP